MYHLLKSTISQPMSVSALLSKAEASDEYFEANLCTMLQSVRGTKQYWFINVTSNYDIGKLSTEDPISVSRKFSLKFHAFFRTVIMKGDVLSKVDHFYWEKEYQARGAPHYHVLLWIRDAPPPVIDQDDPELGFRRGLLVIFLTRNPVLSCTDWLLGTNCTSAVHTASGRKNAAIFYYQVQVWVSSA